MEQHGAVYFFENVSPDLDDVVGANAEDVPIEGRVVDRCSATAPPKRHLAAKTSAFANAVSTKSDSS